MVDELSNTAQDANIFLLHCVGILRRWFLQIHLFKLISLFLTD